MALVVVAIVAVGVISLVLDDAKIAQRCDVCLDMDCVRVKDWWTCSTPLPIQAQASCLFDQNGNATTTITCPSVSDLRPNIC